MVWAAGRTKEVVELPPHDSPMCIRVDVEMLKECFFWLIRRYSG